MERGLRKNKVGKVISNKMDKTIVVAVERLIKGAGRIIVNPGKIGES